MRGKMKVKWWRILGLALGLAAAAAPSSAQDATPLGSAVPDGSKPSTVESRFGNIEERLERLERLERTNRPATPSADAAAAPNTTAAPAGGGQTRLTSPYVTSGSDGFVLESAEGDYRVQIGLLLQADGQFGLSDS